MGPQAPQPSDWLVQTKLRPPLPRSDVIPRPRLLAALRDGLISRRLTLLSAPTGYGKTTLLAEWIHHHPAQIAWLRLDEGDNDPALFLAYLVAALQRLHPACGATAQTLLTSLPGLSVDRQGADVQAQRIVGVLINDVLETLPDPFALILDDLHLVTEPAVYLALDYLLEHLPPQMHLAVATRHDPPLALARLRARGQLAELRLPALRFTLDEATAFLNETLRLGLTADDLAALQARTEGWPVGLRLLAGSLNRIPTPADRAAFIAHLAHTDRHVFDFLADEVLSRQEPAVRTFLLETSILFELTPARCQAVTGRNDAPAILEDLYRRSLFLVAVDAAGTTFRFHALFAEFLRQRLAQEMPDRVCHLHRRAAETQADPSRAMRHYLAAEMWEEATQAIMQASMQLYQQGLVDTLAGWVRALPPPVREAHPGLLGELLSRALFKGELEEAQSLLERLMQVHEAAGDEEAQG
jgi:LuxR family maltose regulon positive regulatory protein